MPYFLNATDRAVLSPSKYSSVEKISKLESIGFRLSGEIFFVSGAVQTFFQETAPLLLPLLFIVDCVLRAAVASQAVKGLAFFGLPTSVNGIQFPRVFPSCVPFFSLASTPTCSTASTTFSLSGMRCCAECSSCTVLEFWAGGVHLVEECEEQREFCECLD